MRLKYWYSLSNWWGKILGGIFGYMLLGPVGLFFGIIIGNFFDRGVYENLHRPHQPFHKTQDLLVKQAFIKSLFSALGYIAKADGLVSLEELDTAKLFMTELHLNKNDVILAKKSFNLGKTSNNLSDVIKDLIDKCYFQQHLIKLFIDICYKFAQVGGLTPKKIKAINEILIKLGYQPIFQQSKFYSDYFNNFNTNKSQHSKSNIYTESAYQILNVNQNDDIKTVKKSYRKLISKNHPDRVIANGGSIEAIKKANLKTQQIRNAYEEIKKSKGW